MEDELQILIIDDNPADRIIYRRAVEAIMDVNYVIIEAENAEQGLKYCQQYQPDCILLDYRLPDYSGLLLMDKLNSDEKLSRVPIIMIAGQGCIDVAKQAITKGVQDYMIKSPDSLARLELAITNAIEKTKLLNAIKEKNDQLQQLAYYDSLTTLLNRSFFNECVNKLIAGARRHGNFLALLFIDLDNFKNINDTLGHNVGDVLLQSVAERLRAAVRVDDYLARFGGDEFAILLTGIRSIRDTEIVTEKILEAMIFPFHIKNNIIPVSISIGVALFPDSGTDLTTLERHADIAMYQAKKKNQSSYQFFTSDLNTQYANRLNVENALKNAIANNEFYLEYQPYFDDSNSSIIGIEALVRWRSPEFGDMLPGEFMSIAEEIGMLSALDEWVLHKACSQYQRWILQCDIDIPLSINISFQQFAADDFLQRLQAVHKQYQLPTGIIELEIKEIVLMDNFDFVKSKLEDLSKHQMNISIDDFGVSFLSLLQLKELNIKTLKIDQQFITNLNFDDSDLIILRSIVSLARNLDIQVIAKGIETKEQYQLLSKLGYQKFQGFYFSHPLSPNALTEKIMK